MENNNIEFIRKGQLSIKISDIVAVKYVKQNNRIIIWTTYKDYFSYSDLSDEQFEKIEEFLNERLNTFII